MTGKELGERRTHPFPLAGHGIVSLGLTLREELFFRLIADVNISHDDGRMATDAENAEELRAYLRLTDLALEILAEDRS